jgi:hypothetical protein
MPIQTVSQAFSNEGLGGFSFRNKIINGAMEIAQRGTTFTNQATTSSPNGPYTLDRWANNRASDVSGMTVSQSTDAPSGFINSMRLQRVSGNTGTEGMFIFHTLERKDSIPLAGKTVTLSFYAKAGTNYSREGSTINLNPRTTTTDSDVKVYLFSPLKSITGKNFTITTSWQRFEYTFSLDSDIKQFGFQIQSSTLTGTAGADDSFYVTGFQLEEGSTVTPFERRPYGTELALCQRYYYRTVPGGSARQFGLGYAASSTITYGQIPFPVTMRTTPTALEQSGTAGDYQVGRAATAVNCSTVPAFDGGTTPNLGMVNFTVASGLTVGEGVRNQAVNSTAYLGFSAEL